MNYMYDNVYNELNAVKETRTRDIVNKLLDEVNNKLNYIQGTKEEKKQFYNLSLKEIISNLNKTIINVLNDITDYSYSEKKEKSSIEFTKIFTKKDRLIYMGIFSIIISFILLFIFITS